LRKVESPAVPPIDAVSSSERPEEVISLIQHLGYPAAEYDVFLPDPTASVLVMRCDIFSGTGKC
jgi:hypothetical protein